jgi:anti-sigma factor RsiW
MICDDAIEMLPWLLNGTLEEGERREVRRHLETCERCREALAGTREAWTIFGQHLPSETLVALAYGEVPEGIDPALAERHLASCPECSAELELARTSRRLEEDNKIAVFPGRPVRKDRGESRSWRAAALAASLVGVVAASGWIHSARELRSVSEQVAERPPAPAVEPARPAPTPTPSGGDAATQQFAELAAQVEAARKSQQEVKEKLDLATAQITELERLPRGLVEPQLNAWADTAQSGVERSGSGEETVMPSDRVATLTLEAEDPKTPREVEIRNAAGAVVFRGTGLVRDSKYDQYAIAFPSGFFKPGRYTLQLYSTEGGKRTPRETYNLGVQ